MARRSKNAFNNTSRIIFTILFIAAGVVFHRVAPAEYLPMQFIVLLCGFLCGSGYGAAAGLVMPFFTLLFNGAPTLWPDAVVTALELGAYGLLPGLLPKRWHSTMRLLLTMLAGRAVMGLSYLIIYVLQGSGYSWSAFMDHALWYGLIGIVLQLAAIPLIAAASDRS